MEIDIPDPLLWNPTGYGEPNLYKVTFELLKDGRTIDTREERVGIRKVEIEKCYGGTDAGEFMFKVNGTRIFVKGTNWVFLDCMHSRDLQRLPRTHELLTDIGCNMVRMWGGNIYENDAFYDLCDEKGILIWQDFGMACAIYSQYDDFADVIGKEAAKTIIRLRNHASLAMWAGDNEVDQIYLAAGQKLPHARYNRISREVLPRAVAMHDPYREYTASSPYIPENLTDYAVPEQHNWGPRDYFKSDFYKNSSAHFISETGYHGCPSEATLREFIPEGELWPFSEQSLAWAMHSTENIWADRRDYDRNVLMFNQVRTLFEKIPGDIRSFIQASQISQAEAVKFFIENSRIQKWRRSGILWWNLIDGWPQTSDAVVDYFYRKKLAYYYIKRVQQPLLMLIGESDAWAHRVVLSNDGSKTFMYAIK